MRAVESLNRSPLPVWPKYSPDARAGRERVVYVELFGMRDRFHWTHFRAFVAGPVNQELLLRNEYLAVENRIFRAHLPSRFRLSDTERQLFLPGGLHYRVQARYRTLLLCVWLAPNASAQTSLVSGALDGTY